MRTDIRRPKGIDWSNLAADYDRLKSTVLIAREYGCTPPSVRQKMVEQGIPRLPKKGRNNKTAEGMARTAMAARTPERRQMSRENMLRVLESIRDTGRPTEIERLMGAALEEVGVACHQQVRFGNYVVDFMVDDALIVVEADGFHHRRNQERDAARDAWMIERGYTVVRFLGTQIKGNARWCAERVAELVQQNGGTLKPGLVKIPPPDLKGPKNPFYGRKHTPEALEKNRKAHLGKQYGEETRRKVGDASRRAWQDPEYRAKCAGARWRKRPPEQASS